MGNPAVKMGDKIQGTCSLHQVPSPTGSPMPSPAPLPFSSPLLNGLEPSVMVEGKPAAVQGSSGFALPPHVGLHPSDPHLAPPRQEGKVMVTSTTVRFGGKGAAFSGCTTSICFQLPGQLIGSATSVMVGA